MSEIDSLLNGEEQVSEEATPVVVSDEVATEEVEASVENTETEASDENSTGLEKVELPSTQELQQQLETISSELNAYKVKARDEKTKRQQLEAEKVETPNVLENPEEYTSHVLSEAKNIALNERVNLSEFLARKEYPDLDEKVAQYEKLVTENPSIHQEVIKAPSPYHALVDIVDKHERVKAMENVDEWEAKKTAEIEAKIRADIEAEQGARAEKVSNISPSLAKEGSSRVSEESWTGPTPINDLIAS